MNISPIIGHEIKHRESEKLNQDVEKFLKGRKPVKIPSAYKPKKLRTECKPFRPEVNWKYDPTLAKKSQDKKKWMEQSSLLAKYVELSPRYNRWTSVVKEVGGVIDGNTLAKVAICQAVIADDRIWQIVKGKVTEMINDIENKVA